MHLVFGGAYQGKLEYVKARYGYDDQKVWDCARNSGMLIPQDHERAAENGIAFPPKVIDHLEEFILDCVKSGREAGDVLRSMRTLWEDAVIICTDVSSGIVPCDAELRAWREMTGRTLMYLGKEANEVTRVFCGISQQIK